MIRSLFQRFVPARVAFLVLAYIGLFVFSLRLAYELRFDFTIPEDYRLLFYQNLTWIVPTKIALLFAFGQFGGLLSYFRIPDLSRIFYALAINSLFLIYVWYVLDGRECPPRSVILGDFLFSLVLICFFRLGLRMVRERHLSENLVEPSKLRRVAIVGAGDAGATIAADMLTRRGLGMRPVVFLDDDRAKLKKSIHGVTVEDTPDNLESVKRRFGVDEIVIAMPSASGVRIREIIKTANALGMKAEIMPSLKELTTGKVRASRVRPVEIEDLLGRDPVSLDSDTIRGMIEGKVVMVTEAGGSIGSELCRQVLSNNPKRLLLVEQCENQLFQVEQQLVEDGYLNTIQPLVADILDETRMRFIFGTYSPQIIFHAAAHKHVVLMERQPGEAIKNNTVGTKQVADLAAEFGVEHFVLISTDKAVNPTNVMGASKRLAEVYIQAKQRVEGNRTMFMAVRFGNVLGSSGSVVPIFKRQIAQGGPVCVTHPDVTRYFMTIPEAVGLVLQCATQGAGGEIFVLDMGEPVKVLDMARQMIELSGFRPEIDIAVEFIGLRPGEKLFEELQHVGETLVATEHPRVLRFTAEPQNLDGVEAFLARLNGSMNTMERNQIKQGLRQLVPEYSPFLD